MFPFQKLGDDLKISQLRVTTLGIFITGTIDGHRFMARIPPPHLYAPRPQPLEVYAIEIQDAKRTAVYRRNPNFSEDNIAPRDRRTRGIAAYLDRVLVTGAGALEAAAEDVRSFDLTKDVPIYALAAARCTPVASKAELTQLENAVTRFCEELYAPTRLYEQYEQAQSKKPSL